MSVAVPKCENRMIGAASFQHCWQDAKIGAVSTMGGTADAFATRQSSLSYNFRFRLGDLRLSDSCTASIECFGNFPVGGNVSEVHPSDREGMLG